MVNATIQEAINDMYETITYCNAMAIRNPTGVRQSNGNLYKLRTHLNIERGKKKAEDFKNTLKESHMHTTFDMAVQTHPFPNPW